MDGMNGEFTEPSLEPFPGVNSEAIPSPSDRWDRWDRWDRRTKLLLRIVCIVTIPTVPIVLVGMTFSILTVDMGKVDWEKQSKVATIVLKWCCSSLIGISGGAVAAALAFIFGWLSKTERLVRVEKDVEYIKAKINAWWPAKTCHIAILVV